MVVVGILVVPVGSPGTGLDNSQKTALYVLVLTYSLTVSLVILALSLSIDIPITTLAVLVEALLATVLRIKSLLATSTVVALLVLGGAAIAASILLAWLEGRRTGLEGGSGRTELALVVTQIHLLGLLGQVLVLRSRVVFPRVQVRHNECYSWICYYYQRCGCGCGCGCCCCGDNRAKRTVEVGNKSRVLVAGLMRLDSELTWTLRWGGFSFAALQGSMSLVGPKKSVRNSKFCLASSEQCQSQ